MELCVLCRVVDNYGDIGFVYRLCRSLLECKLEIKLNIVVDNLKSFNFLMPHVQLEKDIQSVSFDFYFKGKAQTSKVNIYDWNAKSSCKQAFFRKNPKIILECFQCGRPDWLDELLFSPANKEKTLIINIEYLTAESWADDFHLLKSGTRSPLIKKVNFMPGFSSKTGGLLLDSPFLQDLQNIDLALKRVQPFFSEKMLSILQDDSFCKILLFSYKRDFSPLVKAFSRYNMEEKLCVFVANGISAKPFLSEIEAQKADFLHFELPALPQEVWDALLTLMNFCIIRGEDSFSRVCLAGNPFLWQAYPQKDEVQLLKVNALLSKMQGFFSTSDFCPIKNLFLSYNRVFNVPFSSLSDEIKEILGEETKTQFQKKEIEENLYLILKNLTQYKKAFSAFSEMLKSNGNLAKNLLNFIKNYSTNL